jgi:inner membrane protein
MATIAGYLFFCTASHGVLDALTDGGLGVAFLAPFDQSRYFFPVRPVAVSPIGISEFFSAYGVQILQSEAKWIWLPSLVLWAGVRVLIYAAPSRQWFTNYPR